MDEKSATITRSRAIELINASIDNFATFYDSYCHDNKGNLSQEEIELYEQMNEVMYILRTDKNYRNDLENMPREDLTEFLLSCKEMAENHDLTIKFSYPKGKILIVENESTNPELIEKTLEKLEVYGDLRIKNAIKEYHSGERAIRFSNMPKNQYGKTVCINDKYSHFVTEQFNRNTPENEVLLAVTLAHEFKRNASSDSIEGETRELILDDTKIIESFADSYGEGIYKKFPEYGILHYIKKLFGETELKDFADYAFDSSGSYWKVNDKGELIDDENVSQVKDIDGKVIYSGSKGRQGTLQEWLGLANAFAALMQPAGYEWSGTEKKWTKNPGKITHSVIEHAHKEGKLTDDQYNLIQLAAGLIAAKDEKNKNLSLFEQVMSDIQKTNQINTQIRVDMVNRAWEWIKKKWKIIAPKSTKNDTASANTTQNFTYLKQRPLEEKYEYPHDAPSFGSLCLATSIINLYILDEGLSTESVENFMNSAKGTFIKSDGSVISFEEMSKKLSELSDSSEYFDYVYYNPETKSYGTRKEMSKDEFLNSGYEYGIGAYIYLNDNPKATNVRIKHYELIKRSPFTEYNPGLSDYQLYKVYPVKKYKRS